MKTLAVRAPFGLGLACLLFLAQPACPAVEAASLPSLFRGVVVADNALGVRVVTIDGSSQAYAADLRPDDLIVRVDDDEVHSIDDFAAVSNKLRGKTIKASVIVLRNGSPKQLLLHLYSYPVLNAFGIEWVPEHDVRFAQPEIGRDYWMRMARGFETAGQSAKALDAYLNALHNTPSDGQAAFLASVVASKIGQEQVKSGNFSEGLTSLRSSLLITQKLFDGPLSDEQLSAVKDQLKATLQAIRQAPRPAKKGA